MSELIKLKYVTGAYIDRACRESITIKGDLLKKCIAEAVARVKAGNLSMDLAGMLAEVAVLLASGMEEEEVMNTRMTFSNEEFRSMRAANGVPDDVVIEGVGIEVKGSMDYNNTSYRDDTRKRKGKPNQPVIACRVFKVSDEEYRVRVLGWFLTHQCEGTPYLDGSKPDVKERVDHSNPGLYKVVTESVYQKMKDLRGFISEHAEKLQSV